MDAIVRRGKSRGSLALALSVALGCASDKSNDHPPFCNDPDCVPTISPRVDLSSGGNESGGNDGVGGDALGGDPSNSAGTGAAVVTVRGQVVELEEPNFAISATATASGNFTLRAPTAAGLVLESSAAALFSLDGVARSSAAWISAKPVSNSDLLDGLVVFDATAITSSSNVFLPVVHRSSLELVGSVLTTLTSLDSSRAQVVLRFVDVNGVAVSGITVTMSGAERVAYDLGAGYTDDAKGTSGRGLAFLFNVDASATPAARVMTLSGVVVGEVPVWVKSGTTSALTIAVSKN